MGTGVEIISPSTATERRTALVTGASSGIGAELARVHAERGGDLVVVARRQDRLEALRAELEKAHHITVHVLVKDLAQDDAAQQIHDELQARGVRVDYLMNNAGFGNRGFFYEQDWAVNAGIIHVNILALAALTRMFLPQMVERHEGRVLNVASMAGFVPGPLQSIYYASKAFVISFSEAIANELRRTGVTVTALCPGFTETEFGRVAGVRSIRSFSRTFSAREVAEIGYEAMLEGKTIVVPGVLNRFFIHGLLRLAPRKLTARTSRRLMEKR
jgi:short-subunit dehydrogenase